MIPPTALRDQGIEDVTAADVSVLRGYGRYYDEAIRILAASELPFTADDIRALAATLAPVGALPHSGNLMGAAVTHAARAGRIEHAPLAPVKSARASRRAGALRFWIGTDHTETN